MWKLASVVLASCLFFAPGAAWSVPQELNFESLYAPSQTQNIEVLVPWSESAAKETNGDLTVHFFPQGAIVEVAEIKGAVRSGMLDIGHWNPGMTPKENPYAYLANLPFFLKSSQHGSLAFWELYNRYDEVRKNSDEPGEMLAMFMGASYGFCGSRKVTTPDDLKGRRVLILVGNDARTVEAWGGVPVFVTAGDTYIGLQRGMGEFCFTALPYMKGLRLMEVAKHLTPLMVSQNIMLISVNHQVWKELTDEQRAWLKNSTGKEFSLRVARTLDKDVTDVQQLFRDNGAEVTNLTQEQYEVFTKAAQSLITGFWVKHLEECGIPKKDVQMWIDRAYEVSNSIPDPNAAT